MDSHWIAVGQLIAPWGVNGEMKAEVMTDFPDRFRSQEQVYIDGRPMTIERSRWHKGRVILKLANIDSVDAAERLRGQFLEVPQSQIRPLPKDQYYQFQLLRLEVWTSEGQFLGKVVDILSTGSNDVYVVSAKDGELLIPAMEDVVKSVNIEQSRIIIEIMEGLI